MSFTINEATRWPKAMKRARAGKLGDLIPFTDTPGNEVVESVVTDLLDIVKKEYPGPTGDRLLGEFGEREEHDKVPDDLRGFAYDVAWRVIDKLDWFDKHRLSVGLGSEVAHWEQSDGEVAVYRYVALYLADLIWAAEQDCARKAVKV